MLVFTTHKYEITPGNNDKCHDCMAFFLKPEFNPKLTLPSECGTVPEYSVSNIDLNTEPEPLMKEVTCAENIIGNWVVIQQTRENTVLQFSEFNILYGKC